MQQIKVRDQLGRTDRLQKALFKLLLFAELNPTHKRIIQVWGRIHRTVGRLSAWI